MKEKPILFSGPMVRAIINRQKTQTRRIVSPRNSEFGSATCDFWQHADFRATSCFADDGYLHVPCHCQGDAFAVTTDVRCQHCIEFGLEGTRHRLYPKQEVGDRLWVRECWRFGFPVKSDDPSLNIKSTQYRADYGSEADGIPWRPSTHMPRWASRITLEITGVRVERLNEISENDAMAEGAQKHNYGTCGTLTGYKLLGEVGHTTTTTLATDWFKNLWQSINGKGSWDANPWVWVLVFKRKGEHEQ